MRNALVQISWSLLLRKMQSFLLRLARQRLCDGHHHRKPVRRLRFLLHKRVYRSSVAQSSRRINYFWRAMERWFEGGTHSSCDYQVCFVYYKQWRKVMFQLTKKVQRYESDLFNKLVHVNSAKTKCSREWCWVQPAAYHILSRNGWIVRK